MQFDWSSVPRKPPSIVEYYLEEALICYEYEAFRMSVVASACALNFGLDFVLRERDLVSKKRVLSLNEVIQEVKKQVSKSPNTVLSEIPLDKCEEVMHYRNAFAHPEEFLEVKPDSRLHYYTLKPKFNTDKEKGRAYVASQGNMKASLKAMAEEALEIAYNSIKEALEKNLLP